MGETGSELTGAAGRMDLPAVYRCICLYSLLSVSGCVFLYWSFSFHFRFCLIIPFKHMSHHASGTLAKCSCEPSMFEQPSTCSKMCMKN